MKRIVLVPLMVVLLGAVACGPIPPPGAQVPGPRDWVPATVNSVVVSPDPVTAGSVFNISVKASDDKEVRMISLIFRSPDGEVFREIKCQLGKLNGTVFSLPNPLPEVDLDLTCAMPLIDGGDWTVQVNAFDKEGAISWDPRFPAPFVASFTVVNTP